MAEQHSIQNQVKNEAHYDTLYGKVDVSSIVNTVNNVNAFLDNAIKTYTSWHGMYAGDFRNKVNGKRILELGCGDGANAAILAALGAEVIANDISSQSGVILSEVNKTCNFNTPIEFISGSFLEASLPAKHFDYIIGKAFIHHLTHEQEEAFLKKIVTLLKPGGEVRFFEPAINSKWLDNLRWYIPVAGRPTKFQKEKFAAFLASDPHPQRDDSSAHYRKTGLKYFDEVTIYPIGTIERIHRFFPMGEFNKRIRRIAFKLEKLLPPALQSMFARSQLIVYRKPRIN